MERVKSISIPDQLWSNRHMPSGAKLLWGLLRAFNHRRYFTFAEVRELAGLCQNTLIKYLAILTSHGCLHYEPLGASFRCRAVWKGGAAALLLPVDLILDLRISPSAKLVWGVFNGSKEPLSYVDLQRMTGYSHKSLAKYIKELRTERWVQGSVTLSTRRKQFHFVAANPIEAERKEEIREFYKCKAVARKREGYSVGQLVLAYMVDVLAEESVVVENGQLRGLVNRRTGGRLHYDILLAESKVALEFQGPQHEGPTDLYPGAPQFEALRERDQLKRVLSAKQGIRLVEVRAADLSFARLAELLAAAGVRLKANPQKRWHMYDLLTSESDRFRERAEYISYPVSISVPSGPSQAALHTLA